MTKVQNTSVSAATQVENKKVKKQQQKKEQQVFKGNGNKQTVKKPNDSALKQEIYKKTGFQLKDTANRGKIIPLKVNGKVREYETVGTLTTGGRILVKERGKEVYHVVSHTKDNKLVMLKDDYAKNKIFYESTSSEHKVKYGKKNYVITNSKRDRHGRMSAIDENGKRVVLSSDGKELKTGYVEAEDQKDNMNDYIAKQTKGKSKAEADKIRQQILSGNSSYSNKGVLRFKASNGEVWYYDTKRKTYVKYAEKEAQAIIKDLDKGAKENWLLFRTGLGTDYELLKNTNAQIIDPEVLGKVNKHYSAEYGNKVDKNAQYGSGKYKTAYEAFLASEIGDDEVYLFNAALVKNNAITDQSRRNEILQTNLTKISGFGIEGLEVGVNKRANRMAAADAASTKEDYQALQDAAEEENKKKNYKAQFKGQDALQTYIYGVHDGDVQEIDDFNNALIDPKKDMLDRDEIVRIKAETGVLWAKKGLYNKAFESQDSDVTKQMFALQSPNGKSALDAKLLKKQAAEKHQDDYLMMARPDLYSEDEIVENVVKMLQGALASFKSAEDLSRVDIVRKDETNVLQLQATKTNDFKTAENLISRAYSLISNNSILSKVKAKMGDDFNVLMKKEDAHFKTNSFKNVTSITDKQVTEYSDKEGKVKLTPEQIAHNKYVVTWLKSQLADLERDKKLNEAKDGWKQDFVNWHRETYSGYATRSSLANKYQLIKSNIARLEAAAEGKLVDASGKPVSFEDAMKNLGETGIQALEQANADYQTAQQTGEFMVDMAVLALPLPKGFNAANTVIKMGNALYKVISKSDKACKVIKITQEAIKGSKIYEVATKVATTNPKLVENTRKVATIMDSSATGAMHMAGKTVVLEASNIATSREGFTSDRISEMNQKTQSAAVFGGMGGAIGGTTAVASEFVSSAGAKYTVHGVGLVADLMGAAGLMTAESHGETNFWDNLRCVNPDGSFNFEQASMTAMMIFGHLHGMSAVRGKVKPHVELQADGTFKAKLGDNVLTLNKDGIWSDSASGREFRLAENKNGKAELTELTKKEVAARHLEQPVTEEVRANSTRHSEASAEESRGTSTQQIKSFKERINNAKTREELNAIRDDIKKTDLTVQERNELMAESLKVQREWGQAPERRQIVNMATEGEASVMGKPELTALRNEVGIRQSKPGLHFEGETDGANTIINEMKGNDTVNSYIVSRDVEGKAHIEYKVSYENGKATDVEIYNADGTIKRLSAEKKQAVLEELNKPAETDPVTHSEAPAEESRVKSESHSERSEESQAKETPAIDKPVGNEGSMVNTDSKSHLSFDDAKIQKATTIEEAKKLAEQYDNVEVIERNLGNKAYDIKVTEENGSKTTKIVKGKVVSFEEHEYNSAGKETKGTYKDAEGNVSSSRETEYNSAGNVVKRTLKDSKGKLVSSEEYEYGNDGNKTKVTFINYNNDYNNTVKRLTEVSYNDAGKVVKRIHKNSEGKIESSTETEYNSAGNKTKDTYIEYSEGKIESSTETEYNSAGKETKDTYIAYSEGKITSSYEKEYNDSNHITKKIHRDSEGKITSFEEYEYNNTGCETKKTSKDSDGRIISSKEYEYDANNNVVKITEKNANGQIISVKDGKGNPIEILETKTEPTSHSKLDSESSQPATEPPVIASESEAIQPKQKPTSTESNKPSLNVNDKRIQETMTIEDAKGLAKKYDNVEVVEHENGNYELKVTYKDADGNIKATIESEHINGKVAKEIIKDTTATGIQEDVYNSDGNVVSSTIKDVDGNVIRTTESEYQNGKVAKSIVTEYKDGKVVETAAYEYDGGKATKKIQKDAEGNITEIYDYEQRRTLTEEEIKEYLSNKDNNIQIAEKPVETDSVSHSEAAVEKSRGADSNQSANVEPKAGKKFKLSTDDIPTKLSDMQEFVEKNSLNALSFKVDDKTILYSIKNDETGGVMHVQFTDGKRSNMTIVKANDLQTYIEFAEDGVTPSKVRTDFIANGKIFTRVEDMTTGQVAFEEPVVMNGKRSPAGLVIKNDSPLVKRFNEGSIDLEGKFTPKEVNEGSGVKESLSERSEGAQAKDTPETENSVVGENETPKFEEVETNEGLQLRHKVGDENSYEFFNPETLKWEPTTKQFVDERVARDGVKAKPVEKTIGESATGNTSEEAAQIHNEEMNNVEPTSIAQVKNLEKYDIMFQSEEGKALLDKAKNDPNFGKTAEERVPSEKIVKDADGNIQSIEIDGVTYTRNEQGKYVNEKGDSQIQIVTPDQNTFIDANVDKRITIDKENNKILKIGSDDMTIGYDSNGQPREVSVWGGESINLSTGDYSQDYHSTYVDSAGRVIENKVSIDVNERKYYPDKQEGFRYSDHGEDSNGNYIDYNLRQETENSLSKLIKDAQLENRGLRTTKKGRQKAYDDVRNQIEDAYNNSKIDRENADNLHAKLNEKAKANGLETQETPTMVAEREALAKWNEQADTIKGDLMSVIEKSVDSQVAHDRMVEIIGEHCKNGKIDMNRANELYDALETKANSIDGVESLAKKAERINAELKAHEIKFAEESQGQKEPLTKESLEKDIEALKQGDDISEYLGKLDEAKKQGVINDDEVYELTQKATEKVNEVVIPEIKIEYATEEEFPETPTKPKQLEKKTLEDILGDEQAPKTADEAKKYAEEHEDAEFVASDDPNICDMLFLDKDHDNIIYYNKDGVKAYREYNPSEAIERRDTSLYSDGTVSSVETRTVDGNLKVEAYDPDGNLKRKELYDTDNGVWTAHQVYFDSEGNMIVARKVVLNKETKSWEPTAEYEYNAERNAFEQKNEKDEVVSTVKYDEAAEHWAEFDAEGKAIHEINKPESVVVEPAPVEEHQGVIEIESSTGEPTPAGENSENNPASEKVEKRNSDGTKIPKKFRGRDDVTYDPMTKTYTERTEMYGVTTESIYDSKGRLLQEVEGNKTKYYNSKGEVIAEQEITDHGIKRTEKSKDYDLDVLFNSLGEGEKITIKYHEDKKGNAAEPEEFIYNKDKNVYENMGPEGTVFKTVDYDVKNHSWTIRDAEGKKLDSQNNMKESHIKRNLGIGAGVLALGGGIYGVSKLVKSDDDKEVEQPAKPAAKPAPKKDTPAPKAETKVTLDGKEGTIDGNGNLKIGDNTYPKNEDGTYTIDDKKYKLEDGKLVEVVDTPNDNGETGGADPETTDVTGTIGDKEYIIKDGKVSVDGEELTPDENGHYKIGDDKYKIEDGKLVKVEPEEPAKTDTDTDAAQSDDSQTGGGRTGGSASGTTGSQGGRTGGSASGTIGSQGGGRTGGSASGTTGSQGGGRTDGSSSGNTGATHHDTSRPVTTPRSEQSEESRHTGNTSVTDVTEPTEIQKQVANDLQKEIANIFTQDEALVFVEKLESAVKTGQITPRQGDELMNLLQIHAETLNEAIKIQNEQDAIQKPEFGLGEVTTPQEPQRKEKREITPVERMELTKKIRNAKKREDIAEIQQEMRQYKVFPGRKNLRRAYKAKLRAIKYQDEPQKVEKYNEKFEKRMEKIENSKVYKNDKDQINRENFQEMKYLDDIIKRPKNFDDGTFNA